MHGLLILAIGAALFMVGAERSSPGFTATTTRGAAAILWAADSHLVERVELAAGVKG